MRAALPLITIALLGCRTATAGPDIAASLRPQVAAQRQCAPLLAGAWPISLSAQSLKGRAVDALVAAGLIAIEPVAEAEGSAPVMRVAVTPAGRRWVELRRLNDRGTQTPVLCYGTRALVRVAATDRDRTTAAYSWRIVEPASWTARADMRAAFPFLSRALTATITASSPAQRKNGAWRLADHAEWDEGVKFSDVGFYLCRGTEEDAPCG